MSDSRCRLTVLGVRTFRSDCCRSARRRCAVSLSDSFSSSAAWGVRNFSPRSLAEQNCLRWRELTASERFECGTRCCVPPPCMHKLRHVCHTRIPRFCGLYSCKLLKVGNARHPNGRVAPSKLTVVAKRSCTAAATIALAAVRPPELQVDVSSASLKCNRGDLSLDCA